MIVNSLGQMAPKTVHDHDPAFSAAATIRRHAASSGDIGLFQQDVIAKRGGRFGRLDVCADGDRAGEPARPARSLQPAAASSAAMACSAVFAVGHYPLLDHHLAPVALAKSASQAANRSVPAYVWSASLSSSGSVSSPWSTTRA
jgi:hypothetical protein